MRSLRILVADDQIPPEDLSEQAFREKIIAQYGDTQQCRNFLKQCAFMGGIVQSLRDVGYHVTPARFHSDARRIINENEFDLAIIDLGWYMDDSLPETTRPAAGWSLCEELDEKDERSHRRTPQIIFSSRFPTEPELSREAARRQKLPVFKEATDIVRNSLIAAVGFVDATLAAQRAANIGMKLFGPRPLSQKLPNQTILNIHSAAIEANLAGARLALLSGIDKSIVDGIPAAPSPAEQLLLDLAALNDFNAADRSLPIVQWLRNAIELRPTHMASACFQEALKTLVPD